MTEKETHVTFIDKKKEDKFKTLKDNKQHEKLHHFIKRAIADLKKEPTTGTKIPKKLWPKDYIKKYGVTNLWKYDLPDAWRLLYTIHTDKVLIVSIILDWFSHKDYERKFNY